MSDCAKVPGWNVANCCDSCHEDLEEWATEMCHVTIGDEELHVCCYAHTFWVNELARAAAAPAGRG